MLIASTAPVNGQAFEKIDSIHVAVPLDLVADYYFMADSTIPALQRLIAAQDSVIQKDSTRMAEQDKTLAMYDRQLEDWVNAVELYESEIEKRKRIEILYEQDLSRLRWWRRGAVAAAVGALAILVLK